MSRIFQIFAQQIHSGKKKKFECICLNARLCSVFLLPCFAPEAVRYPRSSVLLTNYESGNFLLVQRGAAEKWFETRTNRWGRATCSKHVSTFSTWTLAN